jgi:hypothetical protein
MTLSRHAHRDHGRWDMALGKYEQVIRLSLVTATAITLSVLAVHSV